jgi:hypothetical protein
VRDACDTAQMYVAVRFDVADRLIGGYERKW